HAELLDEVTALVELPSVYVGRFDPAYLEVPQECLILTMRQNQKYFPLFDPAGKLLPKFLIVSNMKLADPLPIVGGNERVVRPRLEDARFFYNQDRKIRLEARVPQLARVVYHHKLGSQLERVERIQLLSGHISRALRADAAVAERAAWLCKADLLTGMVGEFPDLLKAAAAPPELESFILERARSYFEDLGFSATEVDAVLCLRPARLDLVPRQLEAVRAFAALPEAESLAAANKRIGNILKQAD